MGSPRYFDELFPEPCQLGSGPVVHLQEDFPKWIHREAPPSETDQGTPVASVYPDCKNLVLDRPRNKEGPPYTEMVRRPCPGCDEEICPVFGKGSAKFWKLDVKTDKETDFPAKKVKNGNRRTRPEKTGLE